MFAPATVTSAVTGLLFSLSLIVAVGAQNTFVLQQGLRREHVRTVVLICAVSDAVLIAAGVAGAGLLFDGRPWLIEVVRVAGAAFLFGYGLLAALRAVRPTALRTGPDAPAVSRSAVAGTCLAFTWLNPAVYLDTVVLLGSVANTQSAQPWWFGAGAVLGSVLWFVALGFGARLLAPVFTRPVAWRFLDVFIAMVLVAIGLRVLFTPIG
ncbi:LysE/ArgO family amino acid transporter [Prauserella cavernicola]|uniref:LysE/ArgO family amino acid transporter n=1 Tax=Prauserella cavernicola TaxID=2800127 RepID=UPI0027DDE9FF|nr:LysE/ArgO family amino acid transporter [Prauserella cavernicola]